MQQFEFVLHDDNTVIIETICLSLSGDAAARSKAGRLSKACGGPVDLAYAGGASWGDRYITTAAPSAYHAAGFRLERLCG